MTRTIIDAGQWLDDQGVTRIGSLTDLPYTPLRCLAQGHRWSDPPNIDGESHFTCDCGREKWEVENIIGVIVKRRYQGGIMIAPEARPLRNEARAELRRRKARAQQQEQAAADADADLEMRAAVQEHRQEVDARDG